MTQKEFATAFNKQMIKKAKSMYNMILKDGYKLHHTALAKGY